MNNLEQFRKIKTFIFDVDGVFTDSSVLVSENGDLLRKMNIRDGYAVRRAIEAGYRICIITGGNSEGVELRFRALGVLDIYTGISDKVSAYESYVKTYNIDPDEVLYMGDDLIDYLVMRLVALPACPADAANEVKEIAQFISPLKGGEGCVRDVIEKVMKLDGCWMEPIMAKVKSNNNSTI